MQPLPSYPVPPDDNALLLVLQLRLGVTQNLMGGVDRKMRVLAMSCHCHVSIVKIDGDTEQKMIKAHM